MAYGRRLDERHGDFKIVQWQDAWRRTGQRIESSMQPDDPAGSRQVVERFPEVARRDADGWRDVGGLVGSEDALARRGQQPDKLDPACRVDQTILRHWVVLQ
jgi:hypothetical protein